MKLEIYIQKEGYRLTVCPSQMKAYPLIKALKYLTSHLSLQTVLEENVKNEKNMHVNFCANPSINPVILWGK